jgi:hypothetical protein
VGSLEKRIEALEGHAGSALSEQEDTEQQERQRRITRMILDEFAHDHDLDEAVRRVVEDQYEDLGPESRRYIANGWIETIHSWTRVDWMISAGREGPP